MQKFTLSGNEFFDHVSYPVLLAQDQTVQYFNQAAEELFRSQAIPLAEGGRVPEPLELQEGAGISARRLRARASLSRKEPSASKPSSAPARSPSSARRAASIWS